MTTNTEARAAKALWSWVNKHREVLFDGLTGGDRRRWDADVTALVKAIHPKLGWEVGPEEDGQSFFALSPQGDRRIYEVAKAACAVGAAIPGWTKHAARPPRAWNERVVVFNAGSKRMRIDFSGWKFLVDRSYGESSIVCFPSPDVVAWESQLVETLTWHILEAELGEGFVIEAGLDPVIALSGAPAHAVPPQGLREVLQSREL